MGKDAYFGIDVSKADLDMAMTLNGKRILARRKVKNDLSGYRVAEEWMRRQSTKQQCERIHCCIESTGIYSESIAEHLQETEGFLVTVINPLQVKCFSRSLLLRTKTDKVDADLLARFTAQVKPEPSGKIPEEVKRLRNLVRHLGHLIGSCAEEKGRLEAAREPLVVQSLEGLIANYESQINEIKRAIDEHLDNYPDLRDKVNLADSVPGIGKFTALTLLCELHKEGIDGRYSRKAQTAHAGLAPSQRQSGSSVHGKPRICRTGNARLRKCLYMPTVVAIVHNPLIKDFYNRLLAKGKTKMVALVASMRKLLTIIIGVLNNGVPYNPKWIPKKPIAYKSLEN